MAYSVRTVSAACDALPRRVQQCLLALCHHRASNHYRIIAMSSPALHDNDQATYWNDEGGARWVRHIDSLEAMLDPFSTHLLERVAAQPGERVLDIGCGGGVTSAALAQAVGVQGHVTGLDVSKVILEVARQRYPDRGNLEFLLADASVHSFHAARYDVLTSRFGVMFFHDPQRAFSNLRRSLRDDARLVCMCWRGLDENPWMGIAAAAFTVLPPPPAPAAGTPGPFSFAKRERVEEILTTAGFGNVTFEAVDSPVALGSVENALEWLSAMGPAAQSLREAKEEDRAAAVQAIREALAAKASDERVVLNGATWVVSARIN